jgi:acetylornithine deacetylase/succinyl-diaminopimelate desuccinylase-like protein
MADDAVRMLKELIRFDTTNPPGNELAAARFLASELEAAGISPVVMETAPSRGLVVARLESESEKRPLLLLSHLDVVAVEPEGWSHPPFAAHESGGYIWGRGALDMKHLVATHAAVLKAFKRAGLTTRRDLVLLAVPDEENGGKAGMKWLIKNHPDIIRAQYALGEFGGFSMTIGGRSFITFQAGEKGVTRLLVRAQGRPGHSSQPFEGQAVLKLAKALARLDGKRLPLHVTPIARRVVTELSQAEPRLAGLLAEETFDAALSLLEPAQRFWLETMFTNSASATVLRAGSKENVIPGKAEAIMDCRLVPGQTTKDVIAELEEIMGPELEITPLVFRPGTECDTDTPLFEAMRRRFMEHYPEFKVIPFLFSGATDGSYLARNGTAYYGFSPFPLPSEEGLWETVHGLNERIKVKDLRMGVRIFAEALLDFCG